MRYLKLHARLFLGGKGKKVKLSKELSEKAVRDLVSENLFNIISLTGEKGKGLVAKQFPTLEDQKFLHKLKEKVVFSDDDTVEMSDDLFKWVQENFKVENFEGSQNDVVVGLSNMLDECAVQSVGSNEEEAKAEYEAAKGAAPMTIGEYYKSIGYEFDGEETSASEPEEVEAEVAAEPAA